MDSKQEKKNGMLHAALGWLAFIAVFLILVILILPAMLMLCDGLIRHTTLGMKTKN